MKLRACVSAVLLLAVSGCVTYTTDGYDEWREFHAAVNAMTAEARRDSYNELRVRYERVPDAMIRLQLAYLSLAMPAGDDLDVTEVLDGVADDHELVPVRDLLGQYARLRASYEEEKVQLGDARQQCEDLEARRLGLRRERDALQGEIVSCAEQVEALEDQLEALKEIESMMSASDESLEVLP